MATQRRQRKRRRPVTIKHDLIVSNWLFQLLSGLIIVSLLICIIMFLHVHLATSSNNNVNADVVNAGSRPEGIELAVPKPGQQILYKNNENQQLEPHLYPRLPHLPIFPSIDNNETLIQNTLLHNKPTIAGIAASMYQFLNALHVSNQKFATELLEDESNKKKKKKKNANDLRAAYVTQVQQHLLPLEKAYRGRPIFPIRHDDSIFVSIAAFREHLLADTLASAYSSATHPDKLFCGVVVQNCFDNTKCVGGVKVVGKDKMGRDKVQKIDGISDRNGVEEFCHNSSFAKYCNNGQVRVIYIQDIDALGPAAARYYSSKLWGGETYYVQVDSHLHFANGWDELYIADLKLAKAYPKAILSTYPPGFVNFRQEPPYTSGTRLCRCRIRAEEGFVPRVEMEGRSRVNETRPTQMAFMGAGFFFASAEFLVDVPFDPFLPWLFMGEEVALSVRAWTHGWTIYAPRKNLIGHQYRPMSMGTPHYQDSVSRLLKRPGMFGRAENQVLDRVKHLLGYPDLHNDNHEDNSDPYNKFLEMDLYGLGTERSLKDYLTFAEIDIDKRTCGPMKWCSDGELE